MWDGSQFIAADFTNKLYSSIDGLNWQPMPFTYTDGLSHNLNTINRIVKVNGLYITIGLFGQTLTSYDTINWTYQEIGSTATTFVNLIDIAWNNDQFVIAGYGFDSKVILTSNDGLNWEVEDSGTRHSFDAIEWIGDKFIVGGEAETIISRR